MTNRVWVMLPYFIHINHVSSHDQQQVSDTASLCQAASSIIFFPISDREWVRLLDFFARQAHPISCLIKWPTASASEWYCCFSLPGSIIDHHVSSHDQQEVSANTALFLWSFGRPTHWSLIRSHTMKNSKWVTALFLGQAVSSIMSPHMTSSLWVTLPYEFFVRHSSIVSHLMTNSLWVKQLFFADYFTASHDKQVVGVMKYCF